MGENLLEGDLNELFKLLDSSSPVHHEVKTFILDEINSNRDSKLIEQLIEHFLLSQSSRCVDILESVREPHDKVLLEYLDEYVRSGHHRTAALTLLNLLVYRTPAWMYKAVSGHRVVHTFIAVLKSDSVASNLSLALLSLASLLFKFPSLLTPLLTDILEAFVRVVAICASGSTPYLPYLNDALFSLFHRFYILFPCNLLAFLRSHYNTQLTSEDAFYLVLKDMFGRVRFHPLLLTATKESELLPDRWRQKETHELFLEDSDFGPHLESNTPLHTGCREAVGAPDQKALHNNNSTALLPRFGCEAESGATQSRACQADFPDFLTAHLLQASQLYLSSGGNREDILKGQLALSHIRMWFESHRREVQAEQNRQLLGKTKTSLALEEENSALRKEFHLRESTIQELQSQISHLQAQIACFEKSLHNKEADQLEDLRRITEENTYLKSSLVTLEGKLQQKEDELALLQQQIFSAEKNWEQSQAVSEALQTKASLVHHYQEQSHRLSKELVLLAEINTSYKAKIEALSPPQSYQSNLEDVTLTSREEIAGLQQNLEIKCHQLDACRAKIAELEECLVQANKALACTKAQMEEMEAAHSDQIKAKEEHLAAVANLCAEQELCILNLQHHLSQGQSEAEDSASPDTASTSACLLLVK